MRDRNNENYKHLRAGLRLDEPDVVEICGMAGLDIGRDRAKRWARAHDVGPGRYSVMTDEQFDAICAGLRTWLSDGGDPA